MTNKVSVRRVAARSSIAVVAAATAVGFLAPTVATASTLEGYTGEVRSAAVTALTDTGLSSSAATEILRTQQQHIGVLDAVTAQLGARQAGGFLDTHGTPVINVLDQAAADDAARAGATPRFVTRSAEQLGQARAALDAVPTVTHTSIGADPSSNQVVVTIAEEADDAQADALAATATTFGDAVRVVRTTGGMHKTIYNGEAITGGGSRCSAGFNANKGGQLYVVDAGHCTKSVSSWNIGPSEGASFPDNDYGLIRNDTGSGPGAVTLWNGSAQPISSAANASVGQQICKSGSTTNLTCGSVQATNVTVNYAEGPVHQTVQTSAEVGPGDSGGCLFDGSVGLGITSGMGGGSSYFQPVVEALSAYGVSLN